ncbi:MAG: hypothetical protein JNL67_03495 [Planctomycetaceae bacterium]|nr:hypothetical protein [Planctomycetaceae bacterium]
MFRQSGKTHGKRPFEQPTAWGVHLAFWVLVVLTLIGWASHAAEPQYRMAPQATGSVELGAPSSEVKQIEHVPTVLSDTPHHRVEARQAETSTETDWRRARNGWVRLSVVTPIEPHPPNFVQRMPPLFWAVGLWLISTWILVWSS